jgi:hypothetical protein
VARVTVIPMAGTRYLDGAGKIAVVAAILAAAGTLVAGRFTFDRQLAREVDAVLGARRASQPAVLTETHLRDLPGPVQRWLRQAGVVGKERPSTVRLKYAGEFRLAEDKGWMPYESQTYYTTDPPALIWTVTMRMLGLLPLRGRDRYAQGEGSILMKVLSLVPVADKTGGSLDQGSLLRYLGETVWFPAGAVAPYITWEARDPHSAVATMSYGNTTASASFFFDEDGRVTQITADRNNDAIGKRVPWSIPITGYGYFDGVRVPVAGEGVWKYEGGDFTYIRWRVSDVEYNQPARYR